jgi:FMN phosphatase YigB (HAD superfamily)
VTVRAVVFDVGETLIDESRAWTAWADWLGVPPLTFLAVCGAVIQQGIGDHRAPFRIFRPEFDLATEIRKREAAGVPDGFTVDDLYPDATACLEELHRAGYRLGVVGNQPASAEPALRSFGLPLDLVASSASWGVHKPDPRFFIRLAEVMELPMGEIAYVGDRIDNDVRPAAAAGMVAVFIRRGPWAWIQAPHVDPLEAAVTIGSLAELPGALAGLG